MSRRPGIFPLNDGDLGVQVKRRVDQHSARTEVQGRALGGETRAPAYEVTGLFSYQSYFDDNLAEKALFRQGPTDPIVKSTLSEPIQVSGYALGLHPSSETPVAVQFETGAQQGASQTYRLRPGQVIRPQGKDGRNAQFTGFSWGLPFGWLGGGSATLVVLRAADSAVIWPTDHSEVVYHRIRLKIFAPAALAAALGTYNGALNWPSRFPWPKAVFGTSALTQAGQPALAIHPTRTALSLRVAALANSPTMRMYWVGADAWAQSGPNTSGVGTISLADVRATDQVWGTWGQQAAAPAPFNSAFQTMLLTGEAERYAANAGALVLSSDDAGLQNQFVDIVRYGRL